MEPSAVKTAKTKAPFQSTQLLPPWAPPAWAPRVAVEADELGEPQPFFSSPTIKLSMLKWNRLLLLYVQLNHDPMKTTKSYDNAAAATIVSEQRWPSCERDPFRFSPHSTMLHLYVAQDGEARLGQHHLQPEPTAKWAVEATAATSVCM
eukprot:m.319059 g.319059  ORF g.319059 m.319059 type:complete len:149 (+) comp16445_c0_seq70:4063-4509(+)